MKIIDRHEKMLGMLKKFTIAAAALLLSACSTVTASYEPPTPSTDPGDWSRVIDLPMDPVWEALVDHVSGTYFAIDNFEKASGLMTLSFGASNVGDFVDGGTWDFKQTQGQVGATGEVRQRLVFNGNYAEFLELYRSGDLSGRMNLFVREVGEATTEVKVRARYVVESLGESGGSVIRSSWAFDTGGSDTLAIANPTRGAGPTRTMCPTHLAERSILNAVEALAADG
ncbi:hypothetical protein [Engelhardtia mirabilis]|uniref:hypothetical protein n=1 Tax=Engelhardtia mirabilis TaxID=2528011 RepID=UPI0011A834CF